METENLNEGQPIDTSSGVTNAPTDNISAGKPNDSQTLLAGKYKSVEDLEKGYRESTKYSRELSSKVKSLEDLIPKAPDNYEFNFEGIDGLDGVQISVDDPDMKAMIPVFKELNLSNEQASKLIAAHLKNMNSLVKTPEQIKEDLGSNADVIITKLQEFTNNLPESDQKIMQILTDTAAGTDFLYRHLIGGELPTPGPNQGRTDAGKSSHELFEEAKTFKRENANSIGFNKAQQDEYSRKMQAAIIAEENEKKLKNN